jgi:hypothetical protein
VRVSASAGARGRKLAASARKQAQRAFTRIEQGLADYAAKPADQA